ncbi:MAG: cobalt-precorrin-5B (C(1))-methyltransferase CbiD [Rikenellaceae bacterium]
MIVVFGGTTEGRIAAQVCDRAAKGYIYSTKDGGQKLHANYARFVMGAMDETEMVSLFQREGVRLVIDAAHPYAQELHRNIFNATQISNIPVIRFERRPCDLEYGGVIYFESIDDVVSYIEREELQDILALTGVKSASTFASIAEDRRITLRVMDREESNREILQSGFPEERVVYYDLHSSTDAQDNIELCQKHNTKVLVTKESGSSGGFEVKVDLAKRLGLQLLVISRPELPQFTTIVYGEFGLRRAIEQLLPYFFELRTGFTTGSAATAASVAALRALISGCEESSVEIYLPNGEPIQIPISKTTITESYTQCQVIKDGGDDPDATDQIEIVARVEMVEGRGINIRGGRGVGIVTLPGVGVDVGEAAINPIPRQMIEKNIKQTLAQHNIEYSIDIEIEVPRGEQIGAKTFNPRLGIMGGISILGTSGIVQPFSSEAFLESIQRQMRIVKALGGDEIAINSGAMSESYVKAYKPDLPPQSYIHYGNLIGATIELAASEGIAHLCVGCMIGKAVKLAKGALDTHSKSTLLDRDFILQLAKEASCTESTRQQIQKITTARQLWSVVPRGDFALFDHIAKSCFDHCKPLFGDGVLEFLLISESGVIEAVVRG